MGEEEEEEEEKRRHTDVLEAPHELSLPETQKNQSVTWLSASKDLGIHELCALPTDFSKQTGSSRFASEDVVQGQLGDCCKLETIDQDLSRTRLPTLPYD